MVDCGWLGVQLPYQQFFFFFSTFLLNGMTKAQYSAHTKRSMQLESIYELKSRDILDMKTSLQVQKKPFVRQDFTLEFPH